MGRENLKWTMKYRPKILDEYIGNEFVKGKITKLIDINKLPQTIMFEGPRGTGKTTMARLLAKTLMCESPVHGHACTKCSTCQKLDADYIEVGVAPKGLDLYEYNITKMNTREDAKKIEQKMSQKTMSGKKRVFILDEMQRASKEAQSSFLKIAEEPPEDLYIILCTTDPQDLLVPFKSRFNRFKINPPTTIELTSHIANICQKEGVDYSTEAIKLVVNHYQSNPRETITKAELIALTTDLTLKAVQEELYIIGNEMYEEFLSSCLKGNLVEVVKNIEKLREKEDMSLKDFVRGLGNYVAELLEVKVGAGTDRFTVADVKHMRKFIIRFNDEQIINMIKVISSYTHDARGNDVTFQLISLGVELMDVLKVTEVVKEIDESKVKKTYQDVTNRMNSAKETVDMGKVTNNSLEELALRKGLNKIKLGGKVNG